MYKVDTLSEYVIIGGNDTVLYFGMPKAAFSMSGSYAITIDQGAVVGQGCSYDGPPTPGLESGGGWQFVGNGVCPFGYYLSPPSFTSCVGMYNSKIINCGLFCFLDIGRETSETMQFYTESKSQLQSGTNVVETGKKKEPFRRPKGKFVFSTQLIFYLLSHV